MCEAKMENGTRKKLSEKLSFIFDNMDEVNSSYLKIEDVIRGLSTIGTETRVKGLLFWDCEISVECGA
jgi:Ca2+-binding EF-hand superfamily protein